MVAGDDYSIHGFDTTKLPNGDRKIAWVVKVHQVKGRNGWTVQSIDTLTVSKNQYLFIASNSSCKVWRYWNSTQNVTMTMTQYGYIPTEVISVKPDKTERIIYEIYFGEDGWNYMYHLAKWKAQFAKEKMLKAKENKKEGKI